MADSRTGNRPGAADTDSHPSSAGVGDSGRGVPTGIETGTDPTLAPGGSVPDAPVAGDADSNDPGPLLRLVRRQELAFAVVGVVNTGLGIGMTVVWLAVLGPGVPPSAGVAAAYATVIGIAFVLHRRLVFRVRGRVFRDFAGFVAVHCGGLVANAALLEIAATVLGFPRAPAAVVVMGAVAAGSYFGHRYISFRRPEV